MTHSIDPIRQAIESKRLTVNRLDDGTAVLLDIEGEKLMTLNASALRLIDWIEIGVDSVEELGNRLTEIYEVDLERATADARGFVEDVNQALG